jgi:CBS domain-containing protein
MSNSERFLRAYNAIDNHLRRKLRLERHRGFPSVVDIAAKKLKEVRRYRDDLKEYGQLRNAIVHENTEDEHAIAEPHDDVTERIERMAELIIRPPRVFPLFKKDVFRLSPDDPIQRAVAVMYRNNYSQIPLYEDDRFYGLLSAVTVARWLGGSDDETTFNLQRTTIKDVYRYTEEKEIHAFLPRDATVAEAISRFEESQRRKKRLTAILITENGEPHETVLGIMTSGDLLEAHQAVTV